MKRIKMIGICTWMILMCGCSNNDKAFDSDEIIVTSEDEMVSDNIIMSDDYTIDLNTGCYAYINNLQMVGDPIKNYNIYEIEKHNINDNDIKYLADRLFDNGEYEVTVHYSLANKDTLLSAVHYYEELDNEFSDYLSLESEEGSMFGGSNLKYYKGVYDLQLWYNLIGTKSAPTDGFLIRCNSVYESNNVLDESVAVINGRVNGRPWIMEVRLNKDRGIVNKDYISTIYACDLLDANNYSLYNIHNDTDRIIGNNQSDYDRCSFESTSFISKLGLSNLTLCTSDECFDEFEQSGYQFIYSYDNLELPYGCNGLSSVFYVSDDMNLINMSGEFDIERLSVQPYVSINTLDNRVSSVYISNYQRDIKILEENVALLSLDSIKNNLRVYLKKYCTELKDGQECVIDDSELVLKYLCLPNVDEKGDTKFVIMPVWVYYLKAVNNIVAEANKIPIFGINAIDGSLIGFEAYSNGVNQCYN